ncbi:hypothetical protein ABIA31_008523 [Catenulispora sp. MAP5-51]|uniref:DNA glycosylase AlkZ-like family protein n=1 Tax=Catenulispora sp. MAP5-51 TaxID=3156298 RepID=UPI003516BB8C
MFELLRAAESNPIDGAQADNLWNWLLERQGLAEHTHIASVPAIADAALGLHAARLPSPYATVAARSASAEVPMSLFTETTRTSVITVRCMRKTLHTLPLPLAAAAHAATAHFRVRDALRQVTNAGVPPTQVDKAIAALTTILEEDGPTFHRDLECRLGRRGFALTTARLAIKVGWERGVLCYLNRTTGWNREIRTFGLTSVAYPGVDLHQPREHATAVLIGAYFDRYGPASIRDAMWWSALPASAITQALADTGRELLALTTPWTDDPVYMFRDRFEQFTESAVQRPSERISFLAHEDVALKAYNQTRSRYLGDLPERAVFNQIGEVLPTVMIDGRLVGTWSWNKAARRVEPALVRGRTSPQQRNLVRARAEMLSGTLLRGWQNTNGVGGAGSIPSHQDELDLVW